MSLATADPGLAQELESWLEGEADEGEPCSATRRSNLGSLCGKEAVYRVRWAPDTRWGDPSMACLCRRVTYACLEHGEIYMALRTSTTGVVFCRVCDHLMTPHRIDRIRSSL